MRLMATQSILVEPGGGEASLHRWVSSQSPWGPLGGHACVHTTNSNWQQYIIKLILSFQMTVILHREMISSREGVIYIRCCCHEWSKMQLSIDSQKRQMWYYCQHLWCMCDHWVDSESVLNMCRGAWMVLSLLYKLKHRCEYSTAIIGRECYMSFENFPQVPHLYATVSRVTLYWSSLLDSPPTTKC